MRSTSCRNRCEASRILANGGMPVRTEHSIQVSLQNSVHVGISTCFMSVSDSSCSFVMISLRPVHPAVTCIIIIKVNTFLIPFFFKERKKPPSEHNGRRSSRHIFLFLKDFLFLNRRLTCQQIILDISVDVFSIAV